MLTSDNPHKALCSDLLIGDDRVWLVGRDTETGWEDRRNVNFETSEG